MAEFNNFKQIVVLFFTVIATNFKKKVHKYMLRSSFGRHRSATYRNHGTSESTSGALAFRAIITGFFSSFVVNTILLSLKTQCAPGGGGTRL